MPAKKSRFVGMVATLGAFVVLAGCERTAISDINKHPVKYEGDEVTVAGQVAQSGGDFEKGMFEIDDGTGHLWVLSNTLDLPAKGSRIAVTGLVESKESQGSDYMSTVLQEIRRYPSGD